MAFTVGAVAAKDGAAVTITGGLLAADIAGAGAGPWFLYHSLVDGVAGVNKLNITAANALKVDNTAAFDKGAGTAGTATQRFIMDSSQLSALATTAQARSAGFQLVDLPSDAVVKTIGTQVTCSTDVTRPADVLPYAVNDAWADSTSAPTTGGFTLTGAARASGGTGVITDIFILSSAVPATLLQGELHIFDSAVTAVNDNAAFALSAANAKLAVAVVPFTLTANASTSHLHVQNLNIGFTCVGTANLRYLVKVKNSSPVYTPTSAEVLTVRAKIIQTN